MSKITDNLINDTYDEGCLDGKIAMLKKIQSYVSENVESNSFTLEGILKYLNNEYDLFINFIKWKTNDEKSTKKSY